MTHSTLSPSSRGLDEIYLLRGALAHESSIIESQLEFKTYPASRRDIASEQVDRMRAAAAGRVHHAYGGTSSLSFSSALRDAGAPTDPVLYEWAGPSGQPGDDNDTVLYAMFSELKSLWGALAYERAVWAATAWYSTFPKKAARQFVDSEPRMNAAARGEVAQAYEGIDLSAALIAVGISPLLTMHQWREQRALGN